MYLVKDGDQEVDLEALFWNQVDIRGEEECWEWKLAKDSDGYGNWSKAYSLGLCSGAHRLAFLFSRGHLPDRLLICHSCDNSSCCNPDHLWAGTHTDNSADRSRKGRGNYGGSLGSKNGCAKLNEVQVEKFLNVLLTGLPYSQAARWFDVSENSVSRISRGYGWRHVKRPVAFRIRRKLAQRRYKQRNKVRARPSL